MLDGRREVEGWGLASEVCLAGKFHPQILVIDRKLSVVALVAGSSIEVNRIYPVVVVIETVYVTLDRGIEVGSLFIHLHLCMQGYLPQWIIAQELANLEGFGIQHTLE